MANTLGVYNPIFYAQEALIQLEKALGMGNRVYMAFDEERRSFGKGETVNVRRPSTFTAQDAPSSAQDLDTETVALTLANWREVKFKLTDKELAFTGERIINDHIRPAAYTLADDIDQKLAALYKDVPWYYSLNATPGSVVTDITQVRKVMFDNAVPVQDIGNLHFMVDGNMEANLLALSAFSQQQGAGDVGVNTQLRGSLGTKFGLEVFANQNTPTHTTGDLSDTSGTVAGAHVKGATSLAVAALGLTEDIKAGDHFVIAGNTQRYAVTADVTTDGSGAATLAITPGLAAALSGGEVVTVFQHTGVQDLAFHRNAFALVMAPLSEIGNELGANIATVQDPVTGLALRSRLYYVGNSSEVHVALDVLYGVKTLDPNLACRGDD